jgi:hypothetical protein
VAAFPAPVITLVQGSAWGGACDLVIACDMAFGDESCAFAITPAKLGLPYNVGGILHFLNRLPLNVVTEMFCSAVPERAFRLGIIIPAAFLEERVYTLAGLIATRSSAAISTFKASARALAEARDWLVHRRVRHARLEAGTGCETLSVNLAQRADEGVSVLVADFAILVAMAIVETCLAHAALHYARSRQHPPPGSDKRLRRASSWRSLQGPYGLFHPSKHALFSATHTF